MHFTVGTPHLYRGLLFIYMKPRVFSKAHILYLTVSSSFLICFVIGGSGPSRVMKFLNSPERAKQGD
jgi:hypothetical protein